MVASTPLAVLLADYRRYLVVERGLAPLTVQGYLKTATWFCTECLAGGDVRVSELSAADVSGFLRRAGVGRQVKTVNNIVGELRSLLRFLYTTGRIDVPLAQAALGRAGWRGGPLPRPRPRGRRRPSWRAATVSAWSELGTSP